MKKSLIGIFILLVIFSSILIYAEENISTSTPTDLSQNTEQPKGELDKTGDQIKSEISSTFASSVEIPEEVSFLPKLLFGVEGTMSVSELIIYCAIWLLLLLIIQNIVAGTAFVEKTLTWIISIVLLLIGSISGGMKMGTELWINFLGSISIFGNFFTSGAGVYYSSSGLIIVLIIIYILTKKLSDLMQVSKITSDLAEEGKEAGKAISKLKAYSKYDK